MKFSTIALSVAAVLVSVSSRPLLRRDVDASLVPSFGVTAGIHDPNSASCLGIDGANGQPILIPCQCPPALDTFLDSLNANVAAGFAVHNPSVAVAFPQDSSTASQLTRLEACLVTLQNLNGTGQGCPASSTTWVALQKQIAAGGSSSAPASSVAAAPSAPVASTAAGSCPVISTVTVASATVAASASTAAAVSTQAVIASSVVSSAAPASTSAVTPSNVTIDESLVPQFGVTAGQNPSGTGNCDGIDGANGQPILIPCACPPDRTSFTDEMSANVNAGFVINNPTVKLTFPLDNSTSSQLARLNAAAVTLQNLNGPGQGCPVASTTFSAQQKAIEAAASS